MIPPGHKWTDEWQQKYEKLLKAADFVKVLSLRLFKTFGLFRFLARADLSLILHPLIDRFIIFLSIPILQDPGKCEFSEWLINKDMAHLCRHTIHIHTYVQRPYPPM